MSDADADTSWSVYIIECSDHTYYTGISNDVERRFSAHAECRGAKYFRGRTPERLVYQESGHSRSTASRREYEIKQLRRDQKQQLIQSAVTSPV
ncbi:MAG TPA: GIY-YIG nuclease family protein [Chromatiaceae bacterium]|jgi:putative endonuclease|nr:GIY-YIG nuclease family protein [Chromatiaceae bacterium]HIN82055.1 GIY-YIG nuclease family protein [Chromatiales bacterium]HIA08301.1 GIY-YIG nuclease family protein [Chromatiaceae bacterium]HIB83507.1 GIY-YIG nuclease family protein [Chromatiaceae bacterium]HIO15067.1 GIY-YIG nuclease family protein [Chromatiales bacterium]